MTTEEQKQAVLEQEAADISAGKRADEFLADPVVTNMLLAVEKKYMGEFQRAETDEARRTVWAKTRVLTDFVTEMRATVGRGQMATHTKETRERQEERSRRASTRR